MNFRILDLKGKDKSTQQNENALVGGKGDSTWQVTSTCNCDSRTNIHIIFIL